MTLKRAVPLELGDYDLSSPLDMYLLYTRMSTKAPTLYSRMMWCQMAGHALGWDAQHLIQPRAVFHNSFGCLVGQSTLTNKTTAQWLGKNIYPKQYSLPDEMSPEQFIVEMSDEPKRIWWMGELSGYIKGIQGKGYMARYAEIVNDLHGCPVFYHRKLRAKKGKENEFKVEKPYLTLSSTITPEVLEDQITRELALGGWLYRWLLVPGEGLYEPRKRLDRQVFTLAANSEMFFLNLKERQGVINFVFTDEALNKYNILEERMLELNTSPFVGRYFNYLIAFADVLMVDDYVRMSNAGEVKTKPLYNCSTIYEYLSRIQLVDLDIKDRLDRLDRDFNNHIDVSNQSNLSNDSIPSNYVFVEEKYVDMAWEIIRPCLDFAIQLVDGILLDKAVRALRNYLIRHKEAGWIDRSEVLRNTSNNAKDHAMAVATLSLRDELETKKYVFVRKNKSQGQGERYRWIGDSVQIKREHKSRIGAWVCAKCGTVVAYGAPTNINGKRYCQDCAKKVVNGMRRLD